MILNSYIISELLLPLSRGRGNFRVLAHVRTVRNFDRVDLAAALAMIVFAGREPFSGPIERVVSSLLNS
jgi:hypothetical protein